MALAQRYTAGPAKDEGKPCCKFGAILDGLAPEEREAAEAMLADNSWSPRDISDAFAAEGFSVSDVTVDRHRRNLRGHVAR